MLAKKHIIGLVFMMFIALVTQVQVASALETGMINAENLNVRSAPSLSGGVLGQLNTGDAIDIVSRQGDWVEFRFNGSTAYLHKDYVKLKQQGTNKTNITINVNSSQLALPINPPLRNNHVLVPFRAIGEALGIDVFWLPDTREVKAIDQGKEVLFKIGSGKVLVDGQVMTTNPAPSIEKGGHTVIPLRFFAEAFGANVGWDQKEKLVTIKRTKSEATKTIFVDKLDLYTEQNEQSKKLGFLSKGDQVQVLTEQGDWLKVKFNQYVGYVNTKSLNIFASDSFSGSVNTTVLNVRNQPNTSGDVIGKLTKGQSVKVLDLVGNWIKIDLAGTVGFVHSFYVDLTKDGQPFAWLNQPVITPGEDRDLLSWQKRGPVEIEQHPINGGIEIKSTASKVDPLTTKSAGIKAVQYVDGSKGKTIKILLHDGYHAVVRQTINELKITILPKGLAGKRIVVDAGHGDQDPGATGPTGYKEKDGNLDVALRLNKLFENAGAKPILTRSDDTFLPLSSRVKVTEQNEADAFVSIHIDSFKANSKGSTTFYHSGKNPSWEQSKQLSDIAIQTVTSELGTVNRGSQNKSLHVIRETKIPAILVELAFVSNPQEEAKLKDPSFRQKAAQAIYDAFFKFYQ